MKTTNLGRTRVLKPTESRTAKLLRSDSVAVDEMVQARYPNANISGVLRDLVHAAIAAPAILARAVQALRKQQDLKDQEAEGRVRLGWPDPESADVVLIGDLLDLYADFVLGLSDAALRAPPEHGTMQSVLQARDAVREQQERRERVEVSLRRFLRLPRLRTDDEALEYLCEVLVEATIIDG